jgi:hypothetical protein
MLIIPDNWTELQHYKDRNPPWIKLHKKLLDNFDFQSLPVASRALAPMLWLLASEHDTGVIDATPERIAFRLRMSESSVKDALKPLIDKGFFSVVAGDSSVLAKGGRDARAETEREKRESRDRVARDFENFYAAFPKKRNKPDALKAFESASQPIETLLAAINALSESPDWQKEKGRYIPYPASWLRAEGWNDVAAVGVIREWHETRNGLESHAAELGIPAWDELEQYPTYKARVLAAHQQGAH